MYTSHNYLDIFPLKQTIFVAINETLFWAEVIIMYKSSGTYPLFKNMVHIWEA